MVLTGMTFLFFLIFYIYYVFNHLIQLQTKQLYNEGQLKKSLKHSPGPLLLLDTHGGNGRVVPTDYLGCVPLNAAHILAWVGVVR